MSDTSGPDAYVFPPMPVPALPVAGTDRLFPVHRIYCVGRNYAEHTIEMGGDPAREKPFFFQKSADCVVPPGGDFPYPGATQEVHHEIELVIALGKGGVNVAEAAALDLIFGYAVGIDMTRRDLQAEAKKAARPWEVAKSFEASAPCSAIAPISATGHPTAGRIRLDINGETKQDGDIAQMIWKTPEIVAYLSRLFELRPGDLIMTGTPAGVGPVQRGDRLHGSAQGVGELTLGVV